MVKLWRIQHITALLFEPCTAEGFYWIFFFNIYIYNFFYLAVVDRSGLGEGKDAQRLLQKAVALLPSSEVPPPRDTDTPPPPPPPSPPRRCCPAGGAGGVWREGGRDRVPPPAGTPHPGGKGWSWPPVPKRNKKGFNGTPSASSRLGPGGRKAGPLCLLCPGSAGSAGSAGASGPSETKGAGLKLSRPTRYIARVLSFFPEVKPAVQRDYSLYKSS